MNKQALYESGKRLLLKFCEKNKIFPPTIVSLKKDSGDMWIEASKMLM